MAHQYGRNRRVADLVQRDLARLMQKELDDPDLGMVTISLVEVSPDLKNATVYITSLGHNIDSGKSVDVLNEMAGHFRHELSQLLPIRVTPRLKFEYDKALEQGNKLSALIDSVNKSD